MTQPRSTPASPCPPPAPQPVPLARLDPNPFQPRLVIDPTSLPSLVESIRQFGFMGHLEARRHPADPTRLQVVYGHRRVRAADAAGLRTIPVAVVPRTDEQMRVASYVENATQEPLSYWDEGVYFKKLQDDLFLTIEAVGAMVGKSKGYVQNRLDVLRLPEGPLREAAQTDAVVMTAVLALLNLTRPEQEELFARLQAGEINTTDLKALRRARNRALPEPVSRGEPVAGTWTGADHARRVLRLLEEVLPGVAHHAKHADFRRLSTDELRRLREAGNQLRGLLP